MNKKTLGIGGVIALLLAFLFPGSPVQVAHLGGTPGALPATLATTSTVEIGKSVEVMFATTSAPALCSSRKVVTGSAAILIQMGGMNGSNYGTTALQLGQGILQAASTSVDYLSENNGCGAWIVTDMGGVASSNISIFEFRQ